MPSVPGWEDIINLGPRPPIPREAWAEYYRAKREGRESTLPADVLRAIERRIEQREAEENSAQPDWAKRWARLMTLMDDVQDFLSTLASLGRLLLWAAPRLFGRLIPGIGWIILVSDLINLLGFLGVAFFPFYALLCGGPRDALAVGIPAVVLKNALCKEVWKNALRKPFSREAILLRKLRSLGRLPNIGNLLEIFQTTQALWGYGLVLGGLYAAMMEILFKLARGELLPDPRFAWNPEADPLTPVFAARLAAMGPREQARALRAARVLSGAALVAADTTVLTDEEHYQHMAALLGAVPIVAEFFDHPDAPAFMEHALASEWGAPDHVSESVAAQFELQAGGPSRIGEWWLENARPRVRGADLIPALAAEVTAGCEAFLRPRRNTTEATFYGACVCQLTEQLWLMIGQDDHAFKWRLSTDDKLLTALMVDGYLPRITEEPEKLWKFWTSARALIEARDGELLYPADWLRLAKDADIDLLRVLEPDAEIPAIWYEWLDHPERFPIRPQREL